jgi:hypothetical protein
MVRVWAPSLGWLLPTSPSAELQALLKPVALDLAIMKRSIEQLANNQDQLSRKQDQMAQAIVTLQAAVGDINHDILALARLHRRQATFLPNLHNRQHSKPLIIGSLSRTCDAVSTQKRLSHHRDRSGRERHIQTDEQHLQVL